MAKIKTRLDARVMQERPDLSRTRIQSLIMQGKVQVDGQIVTKSGVAVSDESLIVVDDSTLKYASRAGFKLEAALDQFGVDVQDLIVLDAGISTGGFTSCLLQRGAKRVYGIDVGYGQVHESVRRDERVLVMERTNLRYVESLPEKIDLATLDLSFISLHKVLPAVINLLKPDGRIIALIKPQFEAQRHEIGRGGIVREEKVHQRIVDQLKAFMREQGFETVGVIESPVRGAASGNLEFLAYFVPQS